MIDRGRRKRRNRGREGGRKKKKKEGMVDQVFFVEAIKMFNCLYQTIVFNLSNSSVHEKSSGFNFFISIIFMFNKKKTLHFNYNFNSAIK